MFEVRKPNQQPVYFSKPTGPVYSLNETIEVLLIALRINFNGDRLDQQLLNKQDLLKERIPQLLASMDEAAIKVMMSVLTGCGKQIKVRGKWVDRGVFEFDTWAGALDYRGQNIQECISVDDSWLKEFVDHGKPINVMMHQ